MITVEKTITGSIAYDHPKFNHSAFALVLLSDCSIIWIWKGPEVAAMRAYDVLERNWEGRKKAARINC